jgi:transposase
MTDAELAEMISAELIQTIRRQEATIERLEARVAELEGQVAQLKSQLEEAERAAKRQAAPFSKGPPKANPKRPGRRPGHAPAHRPKPERVDRIVEVPLLQEGCPACGGLLTDERVEEQFLVDIPPVEPIVTQFNIHIAYCTTCGRRVQGRHPEQTSDALGAAAVQIGPRALGLAAELKHGLGVPYRKVEHMLAISFGLEVCPGALARAGQRLTRQAEPTYARLTLRLRQSQSVCGDQTGWKVGGKRAWLWVFTSQEVTVYVIDPSRAHEVAERVLGEDFDGVLSCDCFLAYDPLDYQQQKCLGHLLKRCSKIGTVQSGPALAFSQKVARLLRRAIELQDRQATMSPHGFRVARGKLEAALDRLLAQEVTDPENAKLVKLLTKQRHRLLTFLYVEGVQPTNNAAERALRPAVIVRKISAGNRSQPGARTHAVLTSLIQTCRQQGKAFLPVAIRLLRSPAPVPLDLVDETEEGLAVPQAGHSTAQPLGP